MEVTHLHLAYVSFILLDSLQENYVELSKSDILNYVGIFKVALDCLILVNELLELSTMFVSEHNRLIVILVSNHGSYELVHLRLFERTQVAVDDFFVALVTFTSLYFDNLSDWSVVLQERNKLIAPSLLVSTPDFATSALV